MQLFLKNAQYDDPEGPTSEGMTRRSGLKALESAFDYSEPDDGDSHELYLRSQIMEPLQVAQSERPVVRSLAREHEDFAAVQLEVAQYQGLCWNCCLLCRESAWPFVKQSAGYFKIKAVTCSFPCLIAFINHHYRADTFKRNKALNTSKQVFIQRTGIQPRSVEPSPARFIMQYYGGDLSEQCFREIIAQLT